MDSTAFIYEISSENLSLEPTAVSFARAAAVLRDNCGDAMLKTAVYGAILAVEAVGVGMAIKGTVTAVGLAAKVIRGGQTIVMPVFRAAAKSPWQAISAVATGLAAEVFGLYEGVRDIGRYCMS